MKELLQYQYALVKNARQALLDFFGSLSEPNFIRRSPDVGNGGSICSLMIHVGDTYRAWLSYRALQRPIRERTANEIRSVQDCTKYFIEIDEVVRQFLDQFDGHYQVGIPITKNGREMLLSPLALFTHVITHEFHHKGQMLSLSRTWGMTPVDTDVIRF